MRIGLLQFPKAVYHDVRTRNISTNKCCLCIDRYFMIVEAGKSYWWVDECYWRIYNCSDLACEFDPLTGDCWFTGRSAVASGNRALILESVHGELAQNGTATLYRNGSFL